MAQKKRIDQLARVTDASDQQNLLLPLGHADGTEADGITVASFLRSSVRQSVNLQNTPVTAQQLNDWAPFGDNPMALRLTVIVYTDVQGTVRTLTGLAAGSFVGQEVVIINRGPDPVKLINDNAASFVTNRFKLPGGADMSLGVDEVTVGTYDGNTHWNMWRAGGATAVAATVQNVTATNANGTYQAGAVIDITVTFSTAMTVTGTPTLALNTTPSQSAVYASGGGTSTLHFAYTVQPGDVSGDLDYAGITALFAAGGSIADAAGTPANLTLPIPGTAGSLGANKNIVIDAHLSPLLTNLIEEFPMQEASNVNRVGSVQGIVLTNHGAVTQVPGLLGKAASFPGTTTDYLSTSDSRLAVGDFKWFWDLWVKPTSTGGAQLVLGDYFAAGVYRYQLVIDFDGTVKWDVASGGSMIEVASAAPISFGNWHHLLFGYRQTSIALAVDGGAWRTTTHPGNLTAGIGSLEVGRRNDAGGTFTGLVEYPTRWNRDFDDADKTESYNGGIPNPYPY